jgi:hypothetical protein
MNNPIYNQMNPNQGILQRFNQFRQQFAGDPRQQVQQLLNSGKVSQEQYNRAVQMANQMRKMLGI